MALSSTTKLDVATPTSSGFSGAFARLRGTLRPNRTPVTAPPAAPESGIRLAPTKHEPRPTRAKALAPERVITTSFERFEYKYWVTEPMAQQIIQFTKPYMEHDPYSRPDRAPTRNVSLYLDSRGHIFYHLHQGKVQDRCKLRIRGYGDPPQGIAFFEVKRKVKTITLKDRVILPLREVPKVLSGRPDLTSCTPEDQKTLAEFVRLMAIHREVPQIMIGNFRESFVSRTPGEDVRMTIDRDISYQRATGLELRPDPKAWRAVPSPGPGPDDNRRFFGMGRALVELKFRTTAPFWMGEMVTRFNLQREAFSKYMSGTAALNGWPV